MSGFSHALANAIINTTLRAQAFPAIGTPYFALFTADPTDAFSAGTEVSAAWYARRPTGAFAAPSVGQSYNATRVEFPPVAGSAITITHFGILSGASPTDPSAWLMYSFPLPTPKTYGINDVPFIESSGTGGDFTLNLL